VSLSARDQHALESIEAALVDTDPQLALTLNAFSRLTEGEEDMPMPERIRSPARAVLSLSRLASSWRHAAGRPGWQRTRMLLWLVISLALVTVAVVLSRTSPASCARPPRAAACAGHAGYARPLGTTALQLGTQGRRHY
jgi:hypothetical protein